MTFTVFFLLVLMAKPVTTDEWEVAPMESEYADLSPTIETSANLVEGSIATITCMKLRPSAGPLPELKWNLRQDSKNQLQKDGTQTVTVKIEENITLSEKHDGLNVTCSASYLMNGGRDTITAESSLMLRVTYSLKNTSLLISPPEPVSVGSMVNLTCSSKGNPPAFDFVWFISDDRLKVLNVTTQVYGFKVTDNDRDRLFYCGCSNSVNIQFSPGHQLVFKDDQQFKPVNVAVIVKTLGIMSLISAMIIIEWSFRSRCFSKPGEGEVHC